jgi:hypothetical protein
MKNRNTEFKAILVVLAFALAPIVQARPGPSPGPTRPPANEGVSANSEANSAYTTSPEGENLPVVTIHSTDNVTRGKTGSFVLDMKPAIMLSGTYVSFKVSGTAIPGVDYVALISPAYIGQSGYGVISVKTLLDPRGSFNRQAYSVVVTLESGLGYAVGIPSSATMWIKP